MTPAEPLLPEPPAGRPSRLGPFRHRPFAVYWAGGLISNLGSWLQAVAGSIVVYQLTGSALAVGLLNFVGYLPIFLFSIVGGIVSDRFDRRRVVIATHVVSGVLAAGLAILTFAAVASEVHLIVVFFALNTIYAIAKPSIIAILPGLVPRDEVTDAVGLNTLQFILGQISGPIVAAIVLATAGAGWAFTINALTFLGPIVSMLYLQRRGLGARPAAAVDRHGKATPAIGAGTFVRRQPWVLAMLVGIVSVSAPLEVIRTLAPAIVVEGLRASESAAGLIVAAQSVGSALALLAFVPLRRRGWSRRMAALGLVFQACGLLGAAFAPSLPVALVAVALIGFGFSLCFPVLTGTLQIEVPDGLRGRVMAFHQTAHLGNRPMTALLFGVIATIVGAQHAAIAGALLAPLGLYATRRAWRELAARPRDRATAEHGETQATQGSGTGAPVTDRQPGDEPASIVLP
ncbi:MAG TPA: MFS transporter [Patescibacteria group bacterium]|nr:MFS transporter [Patescibacteria group bacterium]